MEKQNTDSPAVDRLKYERELWAKNILNIAGVDEAGRGPLAGPVVAAAVILPKSFQNDELRDSKKLSPKKRDRLFDVIVESALSYGIGEVSHEKIDQINIREATFLAMKKALGTIKIKPDYILVDGHELVGSIYPQLAIIKGDDKSLSIAAASILAKVTRDRMMMELDRQYPQYGFAKHKGYGTRHHCDMIRQNGPCPIHRTTFLGKILK